MADRPPRRSSSAGRGRLAGVGIVVVALAALIGCTRGVPDPPGTSPSPSPARPFTVMTTDKIITADPAAVADQGSQMLTLNVFQRLMTADPGADVLKPDAARDCIFESTTSYVCTLNKHLKFHNGHALTSSDVKFSIDRATRLDVAGSSAGLLGSIRQVLTPDDLTVKFILSREDTQIGWALAAPAAAIVDQESYSPDVIQADAKPVVGSGPFSVAKRADHELQLTRFPDYVGRDPARLQAMTIRTMPDSASIEEAMAAHQVDVVWRGLSGAALTRFDRQMSGTGRTTGGYTRTTLAGARVHELMWTTTSPHRSNTALRAVVSGALQEDRTLDSIVPPGTVGHVGAFKTGGTSSTPVTWTDRITLTLGYDPSAPDSLDQAGQIRTRLEAAGGISVRLVDTDAAGTPATDLRLIDRKAWSDTAIAWLQPYLSAPPESSKRQVQVWEQTFLSTIVAASGQTLLTSLQQQAAVDAVILPVSQGDEQVFLADGMSVRATAFGPGYQLGLWGFTHA